MRDGAEAAVVREGPSFLKRGRASDAEGVVNECWGANVLSQTRTQEEQVAEQNAEARDLKVMV